MDTQVIDWSAKDVKMQQNVKVFELDHAVVH